jgi:tripartite-type tricarboxylate transporter receptor subunit TctC
MIRSLRLLACLTAVVIPGLTLPALAQGQGSFPTKPIRLIVPFPAGGSIDMVGRIIGPKLSAEFGQPVIVDNHPGASGNIGMDHVAKAPKDGHTLLVAHAGLASNGVMFEKLPFDPLRDLAPVIRIADQPNVVIVNPKWPFKTLGDLITHVRRNPGKLSFGTSGVGGPQDVAARVFMQMTGTDMLNVAYKGGAPALSDLLGGQIDLMFETSPTAVPYAQSGKLVALAVTSPKRISTLPNVPTVAEAGVPGYQYIGWVALVAPAGTPEAIVNRLNEVVQRQLATADLQKQLADISLLVAGGSVADFAAFLRREADFYAKFVKDTGFVPM